MKEEPKFAFSFELPEGFEGSEFERGLQIQNFTPAELLTWWDRGYKIVDAQTGEPYTKERLIERLKKCGYL